MPEDIPGCLFSPAEVSAVGSVPMCPAPSTESAEQEESETFSPRECQQPEALVRKRLPSLWCTSHSPSVCETDPACVLEKSTQWSRVGPVLPHVFVDSSGHLVIVTHGPDVTR